MRDPLATYLQARPGSPLHTLAEAALARDGELEAQREAGPEHPLMQYADELEAGADQLRLEMTGYDERANVRLELARYLERMVIPGCADPRVRKLPEKLRAARQRCWFQLNLQDAGTRIIWDEKAGEPLLCPDDAREEGMRLQRRLEGKLEELARAGYRVYYGVLTIENAEPGELEARIEKLWRKFRRALKAKVETAPGDPRRKKDLPRRFPFLGAIATLEAPLSASRTWHPHLNVIVVTRGYFDWAEWWPYWQCVSHWQLLKPGNVAAAFRELIKYAVRAVPEKSAAKAKAVPTCDTCTSSSASWSAAPSATSLPQSESKATGSATTIRASGTESTVRSRTSARSSSSSPPSTKLEPPEASSRSRSKAPGPAMVEWTAAEWLEWWAAMKGRRRTRTYGELFGLNVEEELEEGSWVTVGTGTWAGRRFELELTLLECIPGDKSIRNIRERYLAWRASLAHPPDFFEELRTSLEEMRRALLMRTLKA